MHSIGAPSGLTYHHNGDFSGGVLVSIPMGRRAGTDYGISSIDNNDRTVDVVIPFEDMKHLVLEHLRRRAISVLEQADDATLEKFFRWSVGDET